jgi:hypothetical protein
MPSRGVILAIFLSWAALTGWLVWHDAWPYWKPGQPPWYGIDIVDEASTQKGQTVTKWDVKRNDHDLFQAETRVEYDKDSDLFHFHCALQRRHGLQKDFPGGLIRPKKPVTELEKEEGGVFTTCVLSRAGQLVSFRIKGDELVVWGSPTSSPVEEQFAQLLSPRRPEQDFLLKLEGAFSQGQLQGHIQVQSDDTSLERDLQPAPLSHFGAIVMPLVPLHRIEGLRPGQHWSVPLLYPLRAALAVRPEYSGSALGQVEGRVLLEQKLLDWENHVRSCLIIEYQGAPFGGKDVHGNIWVEQATGRVLKVVWDRLWGQKWEFERLAGVGNNQNRR